MSDRLAFLEKNAGFRRIDLHWCLTIEPSQVKAFERNPQENAYDTFAHARGLGEDRNASSRHISAVLSGLRLLEKNETFQFFSYLFNLEEWADAGPTPQRYRR